MSDDHGESSTPARRARVAARGDLSPNARRLGLAAGILAGSGVLSLLLYAVRCPEPVSVVGGGLLVGGAVAAACAAVGFLFGIPRALAAQQESAAGTGHSRARYAANTNLEQISDWLTKLLVGAGLTQLGSLSRHFSALCGKLAPLLGDQAGSPAIAGALVAEFGVLGFLGGWLCTRLLLASALSEADRRALDSFVEAENLSGLGEQAGADSLRALAMEELGLPRREARRYDDLRRHLPTGVERTMHMQSLVEAARDSARDSALSPAQVREFFARGGEGERIYALALMQGDPDAADLDLALDTIERSRSAFEQYQALVVAEILIPTLSSADRARLAESLHEQLRPGSYVSRSQTRRAVAERILRALR